MKIAQIAYFSLAAWMVALPVSGQTPVHLVNPGFEAGLTGWTLFTTANGTVGPPPLPTTVAAAINGNPASKAAVFVVGQKSLNEGVEEGGGVYQWFDAPAGTVTVSADVAGLFHASADSRLPDSARFWLVIDGQIVSRLDLGPMQTWAYPLGCQIPFSGLTCTWMPDTVEAVLSGSATVGPGPHYLMIVMTRGYVAFNPDSTEPPPFYQFLDNVAVTWTNAANQ